MRGPLQLRGRSRPGATSRLAHGLYCVRVIHANTPVREEPRGAAVRFLRAGIFQRTSFHPDPSPSCTSRAHVTGQVWVRLHRVPSRTDHECIPSSYLHCYYLFHPDKCFLE